MSDWITDFIEQTQTIRSPESFRLWSAISAVAMALERRVWTATSIEGLHPNLYIVLVGLPASGKTNAVRAARRSVVASGAFVGPDDPTRASFFDELDKSSKLAINGMGSIMYAAMSMLCREFGVLFKQHDEIFPFLTDLYDNLPSFNAPRRTSTSVNIEAPTINILAAATPAAIGALPERAWGEGFTSRVIFIYGTAPIEEWNFFEKRKPQLDLNLGERLKTVFKDLHGEFEWNSDAQESFNQWINNEDQKFKPTYGRLVNYNGRRTVFMAKLCMISAVSAEHGLNVMLSDFERARDWLYAAESTMPDVFRAMVQKSDAQLLQDCHYHFHTKYNSIVRDGRRKPISETEIWKWFEEKSTSDKTPQLIKALVESGRLVPTMGKGQYVPANLDF